jgi:hypothetical protein
MSACGGGAAAAAYGMPGFIWCTYCDCRSIVFFERASLISGERMSRTA